MTDPAGGMTNAERLLATIEIQQLAHRYAVALDARDIDAFECTAPAGRVQAKQPAGAACACP